jgi:glycosyltransferase involved in cell wall biosynthesis
MLQDGENGVLVRPEDPAALAEGIVRALTEPGLRRRLVEGGYRTLARYSEEEIMRRIEGLYREVVG